MAEPETFVINYANNGQTPVRYSCEQLITYNQVSSISVEYYYDILHDNSEDEAAIVAQAEADLLADVAAAFGLADGARCSIPPINALWLVDVESDPQDELMQFFGKTEYFRVFMNFYRAFLSPLY